MSEQDNTQNNRSLELSKRVVTTESFIAEAKEIYGDRYDYSKVVYKNKEHRVTIVCPVHGDFQIYAREHLDGKGCPKCEKGEKFLAKLKEKFGDKFGLNEFVYESSTSPVTLICPIHGAFSRKPQQILNLQFGCPMCGSDAKEEIHDAAVARKEEKKRQKQKEREEFEAQRLNEWLQEREEREKIRERALRSFLAGHKPREYFSPFQIYQGRVDEHIEGIRYGGWKTNYYQPYKLDVDEAKKLPCYREGDMFYRFPNEAPDDLFRQAFEKDYEIYGRSMEETLSHRRCIISFVGNDLIIQEESYEHDLERFNVTSPSKVSIFAKEIPDRFVSIDFETLYSQRVSVCSIGMVKYSNGQIIDRFYSLVRPPFDYPGKSGKELTWVHGISKEMLKNEKTFAELLPQIEDFVDGLPLVAHNSSAEKSCIIDSCAHYNIETKLDYENILDTLPISKEAEAKVGIKAEGKGTHSLDAVCRRFGVKELDHHNALEDAEMCGNLMCVFREILVNNKPFTINTENEEKENDVPAKSNMSNLASVNTANIDKKKKSGCLGIILFALIISVISSL